MKSGLISAVKRTLCARIERLNPRSSVTLAIGIAIGIFVLASRILVVSRYGSSLPFWDQWGAESMLLYRPLLEGYFDWHSLFRAHSEHRIFFTRIWAILLFVANQMQWDGLVQAYANAFLVAVACGAASAWAWGRVDHPTYFVVFGILTVAVAVPIGWENTIVGFQSCFYFVGIFSVLAICCVSQTSASWRSAVRLVLLCAAAYFSLGSGLLVIPAVIMVVVARYWVGDLCASWTIRLILLLAIQLFVEAINTPFGVLTNMHSQTPTEFFHALNIVASWPIDSAWGALIWVPFGFWVFRTATIRSTSSTDLVFSGVAAWVLLVAASIAYTRGKSLVLLESRYLDTLVLGFIANAGLAISMFRRITTDRYRRSRWVAAIVLVFAAANVLTIDWISRSNGAVDRSGNMRLATINVAEFIKGRTDAIIDRPIMQIPMAPQEVSALGAMLSDEVVRSYLPLSVAPRVSGSNERLCQLEAGAVSCSISRAATEGSAVSVGALSMLSFRLWSATRRPWMKRLAASDGASRSGGAVNCQFEMINGRQQVAPKYTLQSGLAFRLDGWLGPRNNASPMRLTLTSDSGDSYATDFVSSVSRADLAIFLNDAQFSESGFQVWLDASELPADTYLISISTGDSAACSTGREVSFEGNSESRLSY